jgi:DNA-binding FrmR family transcriptional regulator
MKFVLHEVKLWFKKENSKSKSYEFLPNKVNVITGDATVGKTSFWSIIDYCLLSGKMNIANAIIEKVSWFGIRFSINGKEFSIVRKSPVIGVVNSEVFFIEGKLPVIPEANKSIADIKQMLDKEFGITEALKYPYGKEVGKSKINLTYRHFLLFNSITADIITSSDRYFHTKFYDIENYDRDLINIFHMVIGVNDMGNIKARERINSIDGQIKGIKKLVDKNTQTESIFQNGVFGLVNKLKENRLLDYSFNTATIDNALTVIEEAITERKQAADTTKVFQEIDQLTKRRQEVKLQLTAIEKYRKEFDAYKKNLTKSADSLKPIEFLNKNLSDQLLDSYETKLFIESLETSLKEIQSNLSKTVIEPLKISDDEAELKGELRNIDTRLTELNLINKNFQTEGAKFMVLGEVKNAREQLFKNRVIQNVNTENLLKLNEERTHLEKHIKDIAEEKFLMRNLLNNSIQRNYDKLNSLAGYKNAETIFNETEMLLQLKPESQLFPLETVGSDSNYMFMHLCFYLGLHEHMITVGQEHVPQFLFIDQPSKPYYSDDDKNGNSDKSKLLDAFSLLNDFISYINKEKKSSFQMLVVEHASEKYWSENKLSNFHTVDKFINGNGLIPSDIYND